MPVDLKKLLRTALDEIEREEEHDRVEARFKALEERKPELTLSNIVDALEKASDEELEALEGTVLAPLVREAQQQQQDDQQQRDDDHQDDDQQDDDPPPRRKRPGRKSGAAYDWWVDDEGNVVKLDIARIYTGEDEPDEVELPEAVSE